MVLRSLPALANLAQLLSFQFCWDKLDFRVFVLLQLAVLSFSVLTAIV